MTGTERTTLQSSPRLFWLTLLVLCVLMAALLTEGLVRVRQYLKYGAARADVNAFRYDPSSGLSAPRPGQMSRSIWINSLGFRSPELVNPKPKGTVRLAFLGASTVFCAEVSSNEATWPHLVTAALRRAWPDVRFDYLNAAVSGYGTIQSIRNLEYRVTPQKPDVIVLYGDLPNDLSKDTREEAARQGIIRGAVDDFGWFSRYSLTWFLIEKNLQVWQRQKHANQAEERHLVFDPEALSRGFEARLQELAEKAAKLAPAVVMPTFSQRLRRDQPPSVQLRAANTDLYYMPHMTIDGLLKGFEEYNRVTRMVARKVGAVLIEGEDAVPADDLHFTDSVHFTDAGSAWMARRVADGLMQADAFRKLVADSR